MDQDEQVFEQDMQLNYFGTLYAIKAVLPGMVDRKQGRVVMLTSVCAAIGEPC